MTNSQPNRRGHNNVVHKNIYCSNIIVYQKYIGTSIKIGCAMRSLYASSGPKAEVVPTNNQKGLDLDRVDSEKVSKRPVI